MATVIEQLSDEELLAELEGNVRSLSDEELTAELEQQEQFSGKFIPQFTKALFENVPFGKRVVGLLPQGEEITKRLEETPPPSGLAGRAGSIVGSVAPQAAVSAPFIKGASFIPKLPGIAKTALGIGAASGAQAAARNQPVLPAAAAGAGTGLALGLAGKVGVGLTPKQIPGSERIGSGVGGFVAGLALGEEGNKLENAVLIGSLGVIAPTKRVTKEFKVDAAIDKGISKGIRPTVVGKRTFSQVKRAQEQGRVAVKSIVENKNNLRLESGKQLPESLVDFSQAVEQTKSTLYKNYIQLAEQAGQNKAVVTLNPVINVLNKTINSKTAQLKDPQIISYAQGLKNRFQKSGSLTPIEADELIKSYNQSLKGFFKNPSLTESSRASVDAQVAEQLRRSLDSSVQAATGKQFQIFKNRYGSLLSIEKDLNSRLIVDGRKNIKGLTEQFSDVFSTGQIAKGLLTLRPGDIIQGIAQKGVVNFVKSVNSADNITKKMFQQVNKSHVPFIDKVTPEILRNIPVSQQTKLGLQPRPIGLPGQKPLGLPSPKDVPFTPSGFRTPPIKPIVPPVTKGQGVLTPEGQKRLTLQTIRLGPPK